MAYVTAGQLALVIVAAGLLAVGMLLSVARLWRDGESLRLAAKACQYAGVVCGIAVLVWHSAARGNWRPMEDNFDAFLWLGLLLALFVLYTQRIHPLRGLDWFVLPIAALLLAGAAIFGKTQPHEYRDTAWHWVHRITSYGGAVAFAVAGAVGTMYLVTNHRLRNKRALPGPNLGSLERLERLTLAAVTLGFALLTVGAVTGLFGMVRQDRTAPTTKIVLAVAVWVVYAIVLHSPINPSFRGRKAAVLSVVGFVLMIGTLVAVQFMPAT
jgi:ABC-type uncharacterized transport system permease subunit